MPQKIIPREIGPFDPCRYATHSTLPLEYLVHHRAPHSVSNEEISRGLTFLNRLLQSSQKIEVHVYDKKLSNTSNFNEHRRFATEPYIHPLSQFETIPSDRFSLPARLSEVDGSSENRMTFRKILDEIFITHSAILARQRHDFLARPVSARSQELLEMFRAADSSGFYKYSCEDILHKLNEYLVAERHKKLWEHKTRLYCATLQIIACLR